MAKVFRVFMFLLAASTAKGSALDLSFFKFLSILKQLEISSKLFNIEIERVVQLSGTEVADFTQLEVLDVVNDRGTDGTPMIFGNITFNQLLDDSFTVVIETFKKQFGEYQKLPSFVAEKNLCDHFREDIYYFEELCEVSDLDYPPQCPFESKSYAVRGFLPSLKNVPKMILPSGDYAADFMFNREGMIVFHLRIYATIVNIG